MRDFMKFVEYISAATVRCTVIVHVFERRERENELFI
jgi:hypothetical protein